MVVLENFFHNLGCFLPLLDLIPSSYCQRSFLAEFGFDFLGQGYQTERLAISVSLLLFAQPLSCVVTLKEQIEAPVAYNPNQSVHGRYYSTCDLANHHQRNEIGQKLW